MKHSLSTAALLIFLAGAASSNRPMLAGSQANNYGTVTTTDATETTVTSVDLPQDSVIHGRARVVARNVSNGNGEAWSIDFVAKRVGSGNASLVGTSVALSTIGDTALASALVTVDVNSAGARLRVTGMVLTTIDWYGEILALQVAP